MDTRTHRPNRRITLDQTRQRHREGTSATTGWQGKDILKVFTTSIPALPAGAYNRFGYTAAMHHNNDRSAFAKTYSNKAKPYSQ
jgi:hypothetical protein